MRCVSSLSMGDPRIVLNTLKSSTIDSVPQNVEESRYDDKENKEEQFRIGEAVASKHQDDVWYNITWYLGIVDQIEILRLDIQWRPLSEEIFRDRHWHRLNSVLRKFQHDWSRYWIQGVCILTRFSPVLQCYSPWKHQKTGFLMFSGVIAMQHRAEMG